MQMLIDSIPQFSGALKCHNSSRRQHQIVTCSGISAFSLILITDTKLAEPTDEDIFAGLECIFDNFYQGFDDIRTLLLG